MRGYSYYFRKMLSLLSELLTDGVELLGRNLEPTDLLVIIVARCDTDGCSLLPVSADAARALTGKSLQPPV